ncbi:integration host factor subunit beta [Candidatus Nucleicultrix amoebiphila]|jgi:integration host factor subunit beta|uniref:Integration host factor subunit beta n=1 Tax=Candidatus Nucleicultrix amoebiphila FS5 TaxID=1414854 RepID=A0A1W6N689_9PROT|nr:integration host factor subunit beta [Candidatus Nucleicultrix amoebiphila]ARN85256.1 integration host factor subunit beta [Candidatus Nucleicultrix amoebiphila FS5]
MTRSELVLKLLSQKPGLTNSQAEKSIDVVFEEISAALSTGKRVEIRGFGVFTTRRREPRLGRNPRTGVSVKVSGKVVPFFKAGKYLRDRLNVNSR